MKLPLDTVSLGRFVHDSSKLLFYMDVSDAKGIGLFRPIYDDACDVGFLIHNLKTDKTITVSLLKEIRDNEGEILRWDFIPSNRDVRVHPKLANYKFVIYND